MENIFLMSQPGEKHWKSTMWVGHNCEITFFKIICKMSSWQPATFQFQEPHQSFILLKGLGKEHLFAHHQKAYEGNRISWYDQQFNRREMTESKLPPLRSWDRQKLAWAPEKSDFPVQGLCIIAINIFMVRIQILTLHTQKGFIYCR